MSMVKGKTAKENYFVSCSTMIERNKNLGPKERQTIDWCSCRRCGQT